ncbi:hypothetical protein QP547_01105 [Weeksella virosa]|uniref:hypothetical protein n=1 Tax=Weeksella virosa TaxID=1014 RepID=UPI00255492CE|nr:hypothetical protein [Weeksella virosa]MDK7674408.1 hypothetical protein [Weeksella virosa]
MKRLICISLSFLVAFWMIASCATKRKSKETQRVEVVSAGHLENDSVVESAVQRSSYNFLENYTANESLLAKLGLVFNGTTNDDRGFFSVRENDQGLHVEIQGAMQMAMERSESRSESFTKYEAMQLFDSIMKARLKQDKDERSSRIVNSVSATTDKKKVDVSFWIYVVIASVLVVGIFTVMVLRKMS